MTTRRLYREDVYQDSSKAVVLEIQEKDGFDVIVTDQSVFFPDGGGQPCDTGYVEIGEDFYAVTACYDESLEGPVYHVTNAPSGTFAVGDEVSLSIDWSRRFVNMQRHLCEHMLSGAIYKLFGGINRGFHMGDEYVTIDIELDEPGQGTRLLTQEEIDLAETTVNWNIWMDLPVSTTWFDSNEEASRMPLRKFVPHEGRISVVTVGSPDDPFDCIACCGTHPSTTGQVGLLAIYKTEANKGMTRIYFDCGALALRRLEEDSAVLSRIAVSRSCSNQDLEDRIAKEDERNSELRARLASCSAYIKEKEKAVLSEMIASGACGNSGDIEGSNANGNSDGFSKAPLRSRIFVYENNLLETGDLLKLGFDVVDKLLSSQLLLLVDSATCTLLLYTGTKTEASDTMVPEAETPDTNFSKDGAATSYNCGQLVSKNVKAYNGKGGGRADNARASFASSKDLMDFVNFLKRELE